MLDVECSIRGSTESYVMKVKSQHHDNPRLFEPKPFDGRSFGIQHFAGRVVYDATDFLGMFTRESWIILVVLFAHSLRNVPLYHLHIFFRF